jgi:ATP adenylyltransferase
MEYFDRLAKGDDGCFLCRARDEMGKDAENLLLWRGRRAFCLLNRFPYTGGHCLVAPNEHVAELADLDAETMTEVMATLRDLQAALTQGLRAEGFNLGINLGRCAGAGLPGHLHAHIVPRWTGDTNFLPVFGKVRVIPEFLDETRTKILQAARDLSLPNRAGREG